MNKYKVVQNYYASDSQIIEAKSKKEALELAHNHEYCNLFVNDRIEDLEIYADKI